MPVYEYYCGTCGREVQDQGRMLEVR